MADNFVSYNRFTAQPSNISAFGATVEELKSTSGKPDANPAAAPFPLPGPAMSLLALDGAGSDLQRLSTPAQPTINPYEGPQTVISQNRNALAKLKRGVLPQLEDEVQRTNTRDTDTKGLMVDSFRRVRAMSEYIGQLNQWSETIQVKAIAASRG